ncbi:zf-HC2 domain-containing protein [candidate division TA06 bacterium]|nr:zf-HC2 domain-containing protein [candidate division TA06 bacterium]
MFHKQVKNFLSAYLDGELDEKRRRLVEEHLKGCQECSEELNTLKALDQLARSSKVPEPGEEYWKTLSGRIRSRIILEEEEGRLSRLKNILVQSPGRLKLISTFAVVILVLLVGRQFLNEERGTERLREAELPLTLLSPKEESSVPTFREKEATDLETGELLKEDLAALKDRLSGLPKEAPPVTALEEKKVSESGVEGLLQEDQIAFGDKTSEPLKEAPPVPILEEKEVSEIETEEPLQEEFLAQDIPSEPPPSKAKVAETGEGVAIYSDEADERPRRRVAAKLKPAPRRYIKILSLSDVENFELALSQQSRGDYEDAIKNYYQVIEQNEKLAPSAQFQINLIQSATRDTAMDEKTLRRKAELWRSFVETYQESELIPDAYRYFADNAYELSKLTQKKEDINQAITVNEMYIKFLRESRTAEIYNRRRIVLERDLNRLK